MKTNFGLLIATFFFASFSYSQNGVRQDSLKCTQFLDTLTGRKLYRFPEKDAEYQGGHEWFSNYMNRHFSYEKKHVEYRSVLLITFIAEADGSISNVGLLIPTHGVGDDVVEHGIEVVKKMPKMKPAICSDQKVPVRIVQPVTVTSDSY